MDFEVKGLRADSVIALVVEAADESDAKAQAVAQGYTVLAVRAKQSWQTWVTRRRARFPLILFSQELLALMNQLENHYRDMCDIEFTVEQGRLFMLQTRVGKRTAAAALRMAVEMEHEGAVGWQFQRGGGRPLSGSGGGRLAFHGSDDMARRPARTTEPA